ncbi:zinc-binding dehydrogenase [Nocardia uniformis]|uniref:Zinc-binding dehydrogenase n=1 Tax=Nocardia uniformis TaxID=53432 RepID=A0A849CCM6_9NOCA|nr:zinc-binding dehydrogenase [Nocardia uniformis]
MDSTDPDWQRRLSEHLGERTVDVVFESIGGESATGLLDLMTPLRGRMVHYGMLSGLPAAVTAMDLMSRGLTLTGCGGLAFHARLAETRRQAIDFAASGRLVPLVDTTLPLEHAAEAHRLIEAREHRGMVVLTP